MKACLHEGVLPDCPLFHNKLHLSLSALHNLNIALSILKFILFLQRLSAGAIQHHWVLAPSGGLEPRRKPLR